jgi:hypothetical protein
MRLWDFVVGGGENVVVAIGRQTHQTPVSS